MSAETASTEGLAVPPALPRAGEGARALRVLAMAAVCVGLAALAGGTFVLSYSGIHALALHAGIAPRLARGYPLLIDAMLVIVLAAVLALRGADLPSRLLRHRTTLLAVLIAAAGADALHAASGTDCPTMSPRSPRQCSRGCCCSWHSRCCWRCSGTPGCTAS